MIEVVEYPKPNEERKPSLYEQHPRPWQLGWCNGMKAEVRDASGKVVAVVEGVHWVYPPCQTPTDIAEKLVDLVNADHG